MRWQISRFETSSEEVGLVEKNNLPTDRRFFQSFFDLVFPAKSRFFYARSGVVRGGRCLKTDRPVGLGEDNFFSISRARKMKVTHLTPREITETVGVSIDLVLGWIHSAELRASNVSGSPNRPRWRVSADDLADFLARRSNQQQGHDSPAPHRRRSSCWC